MRTSFAFALLLALNAASAAAQNSTDFSIDSLSPEKAHFSVGDIIQFNGAAVSIPVTSLGLPASANIDAFSYGKDRLVPAGPGFFVALEFSVGRGAIGAGGVVTLQSQGDGSAGDKFRIYILRNGRTIGPVLESNSDKHGLTPLPAVESDIDALSFVAGEKKPVFWSVDPPTARALGLDPGTIYVTDEPGVSGYRVYRTAAAMGFAPLEDIDGLAIADLGRIGEFDAADVIYITMTNGQVRGTYCGGQDDCVIQINPTRGPGLLPIGQMVISDDQLDLGSQPTTDELDAITGVDPGPCLDEVPPPKQQQKQSQQQAQRDRTADAEIAKKIGECITAYQAGLSQGDVRK
jgi:hypothetical protein